MRPGTGVVSAERVFHNESDINIDTLISSNRPVRSPSPHIMKEAKRDYAYTAESHYRKILVLYQLILVRLLLMSDLNHITGIFLTISATVAPLVWAP